MRKYNFFAVAFLFPCVCFGDFADPELCTYYKSNLGERSEYLMYLGDCYRRGDFGEVTKNQAEYWYRKASEVGVQFSEERIWVMHLFDFEDQDLKVKAFNSLKSSKQRSSQVGFVLGVAYLNGLGVDVDVGEARKHIERSARQGTNWMAIMTAYIYALKDGDEDLASTWKSHHQALYGHIYGDTWDEVVKEFLKNEFVSKFIKPHFDTEATSSGTP